MPETAADRALLGYYGQPGGQYQGIRLGEDYRNMVLDELMRSIGSLQSQSLNRISPDMPLATQLSLRRGIAQGGAEQLRKGEIDINKFIAESNRNALLTMLGLKQQEEVAKISGDAQQSANILGLLGSFGGGAGYYLGSKI